MFKDRVTRMNICVSLPLFLLGVCLIQYTWAQEECQDSCTPIEIKRPAVRPLDLTGTDLTTNYCESQQKECKSDNIVSTFAADTHQCLARCNRKTDAGEECLSAYYADKTCYLRKKRCNDDELVPGAGNTYYRLKKGEDCPGGKDIFTFADNYGNLFCKKANKVCKKNNLYRKPQRVLTAEACINKCGKIMSCGSVSFDADTKSPCNPLGHQCSDADLVDEAGTDTYIRLEEGQSSCC